MAYSINMMSVAQLHPPLDNIQQIHGFPITQGFFSAKAAGEPLDGNAVIEAEDTVQTLVLSQKHWPQVIQDDVVETAKNRAHLLRQMHATTQFGHPAIDHPGLHQFLQQQFDQINQRFDQQQAITQNIRIVARNQRSLDSPLLPLQKYIPGDGNALAQGLASTPAQVQAVQIFQPNGNIGAVMPNFNPQVDAYGHVDVLHLIIFYNDNFGIAYGDQLPQRKHKIRTWLLEHF
ncbi:hypothetical protein JB92DRAFT_2832592 [Gautieria morchelliformis]|nr:hypothetical protein JB92DRAFT_2832592 [Gautieria morchelliformis]